MLPIAEFAFRAEDRGRIAAFGAYCRNHGIPVEPVRVESLGTGPVENATTGSPTDSARRCSWLQQGHYDEPRGASLAEMVTERGISRQALAAWLRRDYRRPLSER